MALKATLARAAYSTLLRLAAPVYVLRLLWRSRREPPYRQWLRERFGFAPRAVPSALVPAALRASAPVPAPTTGRLWLHAVSLGETRAASALIDELRRQRPGLRLLLTHGTATGREAGAALLREGDGQAWLPYDTPGSVRRFLATHRPAAGVIMETEIWPNLLHAAHQAGVPLLLANARLSERSRRKGERFYALMRPAAACLDVALAQTEADAERLRAAGVREVQVLGNLKFDMEPPAELLAAGRAWRAALARPVVMLAVSREGEEAALLKCWTVGGAARPLLLIVPRHPQRFDEVAALVAAHGLRLARRSAWGSSLDGPWVGPGAHAAAGPREHDAEGTGRQTEAEHASAADVWLGDSMREMPLYYALADVALLGGSFEPLGGQNLIEAAACGCPLLMGPHTFNFAQAAELAMAAGAAERVADLSAATQRALDWLRAPGALAERSRSAKAFAAQHRGAAGGTAGAILARVRQRHR